MSEQITASPLLSDAASRYLDAGLCVLPALRADKRPATGRWNQYRERLPTGAEVSAWFANRHDGLCIVCGRTSGHLEIIDFDAGGECFAAWSSRVPPELMARLVVERTPSGGYHVVYRCGDPVCGNLKLAQRRNGKGIATLIETRGEGGLFLCAPTQGYEVIQGDVAAPPVLGEADRDLLMQAAWEFNEYVPPVVDGPRMCADNPHNGDCPPHIPHNGPMSASPPAHPSSPSDNSHRPGDDYNERGDVRALLEKHGWSLARGGENEYWRRPGKESGWSATMKGRVFYVFSANAAPFEPSRAYSPFSVYTLLACGGDYEEAARSLRICGYGGDYATVIPTGVDISCIIGRIGEDEDDDFDNAGRPPDIPDPGPIPPDMLHIPGFVGEIMDHCLATAPYPNRVMAFCGALSLLAFLSARKVRDPGDNRTNVYLLGLAHSAAGKDWPRKLNTRIAHKVGLANCLGERFASGEGIQDALFQTPAMLFQTDEIDGILQSINRARDARHETIMSTLLTMYSSANSVYPMRRKAGKENPGVIDQPGLVIFGTAIPNHYYEALSQRMLTNGFFARMLILEAGPRGPGQEPVIGDPPPGVIATARWWADYRPGTGNLVNWHPVPRIIEYTREAAAMLVETREAAEAEYAAAEARSDPVGTTVWGRVSEQTRKLALLHAISANPETPYIGADAVGWASAFVMHQTRRMLFMAAGHVAENEFDALLKRAVRHICAWQEKNGTDALMPVWELRRRINQRPRDFDDIVKELGERGIAVLDQQLGKTKPKTGFKLL